ncbi:hypothetical protein TNCV_4035211 [Trichonephila clavipes]|nr:hypothetical protein TNCV_4035211 [Trichonephila clavipes]
MVKEANNAAPSFPSRVFIFSVDPYRRISERILGLMFLTLRDVLLLIQNYCDEQHNKYKKFLFPAPRRNSTFSVPVPASSVPGGALGSSGIIRQNYGYFLNPDFRFSFTSSKYTRNALFAHQD